MTKGILIVMLLTSLSTGLLAQAPPWLWTASGMDQGGGISAGIAVDKHGDIYMTGEFTGTLSIGSQTLSSNGFKDVFIAKFNPSGGLVWVRTGGGIYDDRCPAVALDNNGYVYIAGGFRDQAHFDHLSITSQGQQDIFLGKYDPDGNLIWMKSFGGPDMEMVGINAGRGLFIDMDANIYITGSFHDTADFGGVSITSKGGRDVYLAKLNSAGAVLWVKSAGSYSLDNGVDVYSDVARNIYITGSCDGIMRFDTIELATKGFSDMFVAKYDSSGNVLWARTAGGVCLMEPLHWFVMKT